VFLVSVRVAAPAIVQSSGNAHVRSGWGKRLLAAEHRWYLPFRQKRWVVRIAAWVRLEPSPTVIEQ